MAVAFRGCFIAEIIDFRNGGLAPTKNEISFQFKADVAQPDING